MWNSVEGRLRAVVQLTDTKMLPSSAGKLTKEGRWFHRGLIWDSVEFEHFIFLLQIEQTDDFSSLS